MATVHRQHPDAALPRVTWGHGRAVGCVAEGLWGGDWREYLARYPPTYAAPAESDRDQHRNWLSPP